MDFVVIQGNPDTPILTEKLPEQGESGIHHTEPAVMTVEGFAFFADGFAEPFFDGGAVDVVVVGPAFVAGVVGGVDADAFDLALVVREEGFEGEEVVPFDDEIAGAGFPATEFWHVLQEVEGDGEVVVDDGFFADPVERGHLGQVVGGGAGYETRCGGGWQGEKWGFPVRRGKHGGGAGWRGLAAYRREGLAYRRGGREGLRGGSCRPAGGLGRPAEGLGRAATGLGRAAAGVWKGGGGVWKAGDGGFAYRWRGVEGRRKRGKIKHFISNISLPIFGLV